MTLKYQKVEYYNITVQDQIAAGSRLLTTIADAGVDFLAFKAIPLEQNRTQFTLFPIDGSKMTAWAKQAGLEPEGPYSAIIITGDEKPGALAEIYRKLSQAGIQVEESSGIAHINGGYGVILYLKPEDCEKAIAVFNRKSIYLSGGNLMKEKVLVIIDIQNDITKNYKDVIDNINKAVDWAVGCGIHVVYIRHENLSTGTRTLKPNTYGSELASDLKIVSKNVFTKHKGNALTSEEFARFIDDNGIREFYITGADATICVKSTCYNLRKADFDVSVFSDCITSWDKKKIPEMIQYYESKGCSIISMNDL